ncbi:MAG: Abi family protein [Alphaproteobacteria bacterium]|nr:Abi family protein [Alphaproteobacteria bacterium]
MNDITILQEIISEPRFASYLKHANDDANQAYQLYLHNLEVSSILYYNIHWVEIILRNAINVRLSQKIGEDWYQRIIRKEEQKQLDTILERHHEQQKKNHSIPDLSHDDIIAKLSFGFWAGLFKGKYQQLWEHHLVYIFDTPEQELKRADINHQLWHLNKIRNRIAHYEPVILSRTLPKTEKEIDYIIKILSPQIANYLKKLPNILV